MDNANKELGRDNATIFHHLRGQSPVIIFCVFQKNVMGSDVSIHAPAKARQAPHKVIVKILRVSIHAPAKARLAYYKNKPSIKKSFNPRALKALIPPIYQSTSYNPHTRMGHDISTPTRATPLTSSRDSS